MDNFRQTIIKAIGSLKYDLRILLPLRHSHELDAPIKRTIIRIRSFYKLLELYPEIVCGKCGEKIIDITN
jgi:hypothetical protein